MDIVEFLEVLNEPPPPSTRKPPVPWKSSKLDDDTFITLPVFLAYSSIAAALRPWNRRNARFRAILCLQEEACLSVYAAAARVFLHGVADYKAGTRPFVSDWGGRYSNRDQFEVLGVARSIFVKEPSKVLDDEARLFADVVVDVPMRSRGHVEAAFRRFGLPVIEKDVELLLSTPWSLLDKAFQEGRSPMLSLRRLRELRSTSMRTTEPVPAVAWPTLADMAGYGPLVEWGYDLARDLADYKAGRIQWEDVDDGVLISGPTGTGKTTFVRALANTCAVSVVAGSFAEWQSAGSLDDFLKAMRKAFEQAKSQAPCILFVDEVDSFGTRNRRDHNNAYMTAAISGFLELLDGFHQRQGVVVVAACNHPQNLDPAIRRAGRLDRHFIVRLPDAQSRLAILGFHSGFELNESQVERFMKASEGFSGADIEQVVRDARRKARRSLEALSAEHIIDQLRPLEELTDDYLRVLAVHEVGHALVSIEIGHGKVSEVKIWRYRIEGQPSELGYVEYGQAAGKPKTRSDYLNAIAVCVGGIAAELEHFGAFAEGSSGFETADLNLATELATALEGGRGMGHTLIVEDLQSERLRALRVHNSEFRRRVHDVLESELSRARSIINAHRVALDEIVGRLMETKAMTGDEVVEIVKQHRRPTVSLAKLPRSAMGA
ncbi:oxidoreductase [Rhizobium leguminosarum bv. viciae]|uniref:AAA family ATPase n=1 Tax=Rhizobium leguminosarum TaxID=384 RepID=UPI000B8CE9D4|nr:AAA family ATPase [Rhizobium leguminosarum]ASR08856.1 oxidoreductase [Rhizobium leguminosarum bv. viciae]